MNRLIFVIFSLISGGILVFAVCSNNVSIYAQQSYSSAPTPTPLSQSPQQANSITNVPIVLPPLPGGSCPQGYHLVSASVCIKDVPSTAASKTTTPATNTTNSFSTPLSSTTQPNSTNPTNNDNNDNSNNNEQNFGTKILKSFNQEFK